MKEPTSWQRDLVDKIDRLTQKEREAEAHAIDAFPGWLGRWARHRRMCPSCWDAGVPGHPVTTLCPLGVDLYRLALHEAYPDTAWAHSQPPVWAVVEQLAGEVVAVRPKETRP